MHTRIRRYAPLVLLAALFPACTTEPGSGAGPSGAGSLDTDDQRTLYVLGHVLGQNIQNARLSEEEVAAVLRGVNDSALGREAEVDIDEYGPRLQAFMQQRMMAAADEELTASTAFVEEQAGASGAVRTGSGIVIQELVEGTGASPTAEDSVEVHYHGTLRDGTVFDSSVDRGETATFPLSGVIPCWTEALQTLKVGGRTRLVCPPALAYGAQGPPGIPPNSALVFEIELLDIIAP